MKRHAAIIVSAVAAVMLSTAASAREISVGELGAGVKEASVSYVYEAETTVQLTRNKSIKDAFVIAADETVVVPKGCTLALYGGCRVDGTLIVENGARLLVKDRSIEISGSIVNDGYAFFSAKSSLSVNDGGMLYTSPEGKITVRTEKVSLSESGSVACLGTGSFSAAEAAFRPSVVGAVKISVGVGGLGDIYKQEILTAEDALKIIAADNSDKNEPPLGGSTAMIVLFDNGCTVKYALAAENDSCEIVGIL